MVESARQAAADGRAALAHLDQVHWTVGRVEHVLASLPGRPDVVVADPPRRGLGRATVAALCDRAPGRVVHVACDPAALARDVALFAAQGYDLAALRAFDAFPMTHHMECVALFQRLTIMPCASRSLRLSVARGFLTEDDDGCGAHEHARTALDGGAGRTSPPPTAPWRPASGRACVLARAAPSRVVTR